MVKKRPYRRNPKRKKKVTKKRIEVSYGTDQQGQNVASIFQADGFRVEDGILYIENDGEVVYANKNAWLYVLDIDEAQLLKAVQQIQEQEKPRTERVSSVMPPLEPK